MRKFVIVFSIDKLQMELQDRTEEIKLLRNSNEELEQKLLALYKRLDINKRLMNDMTDTIARQQKFVNDAISGEVVESVSCVTLANSALYF